MKKNTWRPTTAAYLSGENAQRRIIYALRAGGVVSLGGGWFRLPSGIRVQGVDAIARRIGRSIEVMARACDKGGAHA